MNLLFITLMSFLLMGFPGCSNQQWKISINTPQNGATVTNSSLNVSGYLYLSSSFVQDNQILESLSKKERKELKSKVPPISGNIYCNGKKATIDTTKRTWIVNGLTLTQSGANKIFCYYQDSAGHTSQQTINVYYQQQTNIAPIARFDCQNNEPLKLKCNASASTDADGSIVEYKFSEGGIDHSQTNPLINFDFTVGGIKTIDLIVKDNKGLGSTKVSKQFAVSSGPSTTAQISSNGGTMALLSYGELTFNPGTFNTTTSVTFEANMSLEEGQIASDEGIFYNMNNRSSYVLTIVTTSQPVGTVSVQVNIPSNLEPNDENGVGILAREIDGPADADHAAMVLYRNIQSAAFSEGIASFVLSSSNFIQDSSQSGKWKATIVIFNFPISEIVKKGVEKITYGSCSGQGYRRPYDGVQQINEVYRAPTRPSHRGLDINISNASLIAPFDGVVISRGVHCFRGTATTPSLYFYSQNGSIAQQRSQNCAQIPTGPNTFRTSYGPAGEFLFIKSAVSETYLLFMHLSPESIYIQQGSSILSGQNIGTTGRTSSDITMGAHLHFEQFNNDGATLQNGSYSNGNVDPLLCMLNPNIKDPGTINAQYSPTYKTFPLGNDLLPSNNTRGKFNGGAGNVYKWTMNSGRPDQGETRTTCDSTPPNEMLNTSGSNTYQVIVTDYWGNSVIDTQDFVVSFSGDKRQIYTKNSASRNVEKFWAENFSINADPIATFLGLESHQTLFLNASASQPSDSRFIIHSYRWYRDNQLFQTNCIPELQAFNPVGCHQYKVEVEDSLGKKKMSTSQTFCSSSGDKK